ncbi:hypothetical protein M409DRAFT_71052 [Zasmidium cellare ATCC 36951]|uniref:Zn(2)-C6 fungal-type domain-containing protein n=1 Tax=Zasmidium cellare ATCC 36951 TaxID=1080233 RepID=A0A6A6C0P2_ZASCE|nr:uncharacterized protein M409DRAFT_71052 [Zasmidium cellare ATCC 36951]KAF2159382.1 hypothetical protein M409DRAFT_71052 [Zasmidium cellare ATCC 36951]
MAPSALKSRSGCLTCLARKKKCDEGLPKCSHCQRLGLACISRNAQQVKADITPTNLRNRSSSLQPAVSNGYPAFKTPIEQKLCLESPYVLDVLVSDGLADKSFKSMSLLGRFCTQSRLVREAVVAFAAFGLQDMGEEYYKLSLKSYQSCLSALQNTRAYESEDSKEMDFAIVSIMFLGLLEALSLGNPSASVAHFEMCRKLLASRLKRPAWLQSSECVNTYRMCAECIIYNFATLSPFHEGIGQAASDWEESFNSLFPTDDHAISSFLGGIDFQAIYRIMFSTNVLLHDKGSGANQTNAHPDACQNLWERLDTQEKKANSLYLSMSHKAMAKLYRAKYLVSIHAQRIHLIKVSRPTATPADLTVKLYLSKAMAIIKEQNVCEAWNPALRWPLTILACAAHTDADFDLVMSTMDEMMQKLDPANSKRLQSAQAMLRHFRKGNAWPSLDGWDADVSPNQLKFLLKPQSFDIPQLQHSIGVDKRAAPVPIACINTMQRTNHHARRQAASRHAAIASPPTMCYATLVTWEKCGHFQVMHQMCPIAKQKNPPTFCTTAHEPMSMDLDTSYGVCPDTEKHPPVETRPSTRVRTR